MVHASCRFNFTLEIGLTYLADSEKRRTLLVLIMLDQCPASLALWAGNNQVRATLYVLCRLLVIPIHYAKHGILSSGYQ